MILVNLLPEEYRQKRRTPVKLLIAMSAAVAINTSLFAYWAWTAFGVAAEVASELAVLEDSMQSLRPQIEYHETLQAESKLFQSRERTLADITSKRISWTEKVDQLVDVIHRGGDGDDKYLIWLDGLTVDNAVNERRKTFGEVSANGNSGSPKFAQVANFLEDVQLSPLSLDFSVSSDPEGQQAIKDEELLPSEVWSFPFKLALKSPEDRESARAAAAKAAANSPRPGAERKAGAEDPKTSPQAEKKSGVGAPATPDKGAERKAEAEASKTPPQGAEEKPGAGAPATPDKGAEQKAEVEASKTPPQGAEENPGAEAPETPEKGAEQKEVR